MLVELFSLNPNCKSDLHKFSWNLLKITLSKISKNRTKRYTTKILSYITISLLRNINYSAGYKVNRNRTMRNKLFTTDNFMLSIVNYTVQNVWKVEIFHVEVMCCGQLKLLASWSAILILLILHWSYCYSDLIFIRVRTKTVLVRNLCLYMYMRYGIVQSCNCSLSVKE